MKKRIYQAYVQSYCLHVTAKEQYLASVGDLLQTQQVQSLEQYEQHFVINRLQHITSVSYLSFLACRKFGFDARLAARSGILHDLFYYDWREKDESHRLHGLYHPGFSLKNARELLGPLDKRTANAIFRHMWPLTPIPPRYAESMMVSLSDKYCAWQEILISFSRKKRERFRAALEQLSPGSAAFLDKKI